MNKHADKNQENKSRVVAREDSQSRQSSNALFQFKDHRPEAILQREIQEMADNSPQVLQKSAIQEMANNSIRSGMTAQLKVTSENPIQQKPEVPNKTGLPDQLKTGIENLSGISLDDVKVHRNSDQPAQLQAHAYAQGTDIHLGPGQEKHLPHEAWHVVQQKQGRVKPTIQAKGIAINDHKGLEKEADVMGAKAESMTVAGTVGGREEKETNLQKHHMRAPDATQLKVGGTQVIQMIGRDELETLSNEFDWNRNYFTKEGFLDEYVDKVSEKSMDEARQYLIGKGENLKAQPKVKEKKVKKQQERNLTAEWAEEAQAKKAEEEAQAKSAAVGKQAEEGSYEELESEAEPNPGQKMTEEEGWNHLGLAAEGNMKQLGDMWIPQTGGGKTVYYRYRLTLNNNKYFDFQIHIHPHLIGKKGKKESDVIHTKSNDKDKEGHATLIDKHYNLLGKAKATFLKEAKEAHEIWKADDAK